MKQLLIAILGLSITLGTAFAETISFASDDQLEVSADLYIAHPDTAPLIVLFHQARWSRGEYLEIAPKLNALGFNCIAVDQRSGNTVNNVDNLTAQRATAAGKPTDFKAALPDMMAAIAYAKTHHAKGKLILWGSSYSSALVLKIAGDHPQIADAALAFAPGEYFGQKGYIASSASNITMPVFITSAKSEKDNWWPIYQSIPDNKQADNKRYFLPESAGNHGSRALWEQFEDSSQYWTAVESFLKAVK